MAIIDQLPPRGGPNSYSGESVRTILSTRPSPERPTKTADLLPHPRLANYFISMLEFVRYLIVDHGAHRVVPLVLPSDFMDEFWEIETEVGRLSDRER